MKRTLARVGAVALVLVVVISGFALAKAQEDPGPSGLKVLGVRAPNIVRVGETVTISVVDREDGSPVPAASVYALTWPHVTASGVTRMWYNCEFLDTTDSNGEVAHNFESAGPVLLVATKEGWGPGLAWMMVRPAVIGKLVVEAPGRAKVDELVTIRVWEKGSGDAVSAADLWAVPLAWPLRTQGIRDGERQVEGILEELGVGAQGNITDVLSRRGMHLGQTDDDGVLEHPFGEVGAYLLVATKTAYAPGWRLILIVPQSALALDIDPGRPDVGEQVTFTVTERGTDTPVADVDVYAIGSPFADLMPMLPGVVGGNATWLADMVGDRGFQIGTTDGGGQCTWTFDEAGRWLIVGIKEGYLPALGSVRVGGWLALQQALPRTARLGEATTETGREGPVGLYGGVMAAGGNCTGSGCRSLTTRGPVLGLDPWQ